jgi:heat shock protein HslJ
MGVKNKDSVMRRRRCAAAIAALTVGVLACDESPTAPTADDLNGRWQLTAIEPRGRPAIAPRAGTDVGLEFMGERLLIRSDCNACSGSVNTANGTFRTSALACTLRACTEDSIEGPYLQLLTSATTISVIAGGVLRLDGPDGSLSFRR